MSLRSRSKAMAAAKSGAATAVGLFLALTTTSLAQTTPFVPVDVSDPASCSPMQISWDATGGQAPWTVTVAPLGHKPVSVELAAGYSSTNQWSYSWDVPKYGAGVTQLIVAVTDAQGRHAGTSPIKTIASSFGDACATAPPDDKLDFVWYPEKAAPRQCHDWRLSFQEDRGNLGIEPPVDFLILPENDVPTRIRVAGRKSSHIDWTVNYASGTRFAVAGLDAGVSRTGGVGVDVYEVGSGSSSSCLTRKQAEVLGGVPKATSTVRTPAAATAASSSSPGRMSTARAASTKSTADPSATDDKAASSVDDGTESDESSNGVKIGGVAAGIVGALLLVGLLVWGFIAYRRKQSQTQGGHDEKEAKGHTRWSAGGPGNVMPFTSNGMRAPWRQSAMTIGRTIDTDHRPLVMRRHDFGAGSGRGGGSEYGHGSSSSISLHRGRDSIGGGGSGAMSTLSHAPTVHSIVPDDALFPPPLPMDHRMVPQYQQYQQQQQWPSSPSQSRGSDGGPPARRQPYSRESTAALEGLPLSPSSAHHVSSGAAMRSSGSPMRDIIHENGGAGGGRYDASSGSPPASAGALSLASSRIPPPAPAVTSLFDPYVHMSQLYSSEEAARIAAMVNEERAPSPSPVRRAAPQLDLPNVRLGPKSPGGAILPGSPRYADPKEGEAWLSMLDDQLQQERKRVISSASMASSVGLPYD